MSFTRDVASPRCHLGAPRSGSALMRGCRPNFVIIGAMKSGSSTLARQLRKHPEIYVCRPPEIHFFDNDERYARGFEWYRSFFRGAEAYAARGEKTPAYTRALAFPRAAERLAHHLPDAKLIYIVRHPLERIASHWRHETLRGRIREPFNRAVCNNPELIDTSLYWKQINRYRQFFPDSNIWVGFLEDWHRDPATEIQRVFRFLEVDPDAPVHGVERAANVTDERVPRGEACLLSWARRMPAYHRIRSALPSRVYGPIYELVKPSALPRPQWEAGVRRWVTEHLKEDARQFLRWSGKGAAFWPDLAEA